jgi:hypothetical protein
MNRLRLASIFWLALAGAAPQSVAQTDLDPSALSLLKSSCQTISSSKAFSFRAIVAKDRLASNGQLVTYFTIDKFLVARPNKLRVDIDGEHHELQFLFDGAEATLFNPEEKLYGQKKTAARSIDDLLAALNSIGITFPTDDVLRTNPYDSLVKNLKTAYVVGRVNLAGHEAIHLVFTETAADWQIWITPGEHPLPRYLSVQYHSQGSPRVTVDFSDWNFSPNAADSQFTFQKPSDGHQIKFEQPTKEQ